MKRVIPIRVELTDRQIIKRLVRDLGVMYRRLDTMQDRSDKMAADIEELITEVGDELLIITAILKEQRRSPTSKTTRGPARQRSRTPALR